MKKSVAESSNISAVLQLFPHLVPCITDTAMPVEATMPDTNQTWTKRRRRRSRRRKLKILAIQAPRRLQREIEKYWVLTCVSCNRQATSVLTKIRREIWQQQVEWQ